MVLAFKNIELGLKVVHVSFNTVSCRDEYKLVILIPIQIKSATFSHPVSPQIKWLFP
jgi:hypothetical protein